MHGLDHSARCDDKRLESSRYQAAEKPSSGTCSMAESANSSIGCALSNLELAYAHNRTMPGKSRTVTRAKPARDFYGLD